MSGGSLLVNLKDPTLICPLCQSDPHALTLIYEGTTQDKAPETGGHGRRHGGVVTRLAVVCLNWHYYIIPVKIYDGRSENREVQKGLRGDVSELG